MSKLSKYIKTDFVGQIFRELSELETRSLLLRYPVYQVKKKLGGGGRGEGYKLNKCSKTMPMEVLTMFGTKVSSFTMLYKLTTINVSFHLSVGAAEILSMGLSDQYN